MKNFLKFMSQSKYTLKFVLESYTLAKLNNVFFYYKFQTIKVAENQNDFKNFYTIKHTSSKYIYKL